MDTLREAPDASGTVRLSVIMPCYNVGDTLRRAVDSILMQVVDFRYEIIIVNDASTDDTLAVATEYAQRHAHVRVLNNAENLKNAKTFARGLRAAVGDYFCVLDGDDYYTNRQKLQKQVDFLDSDVRGEYVGVTHYFVVDSGDGRLNFTPMRRVDSFTYPDFLNGTYGYYHTSTYMYRNAFRDAPLALFDMEEFRGDTPRTLFHLKYTNKKIKVLRFVGSAYSFTGVGIWTKLTEKQQSQYQINMYKNLSRYLDTAFEQKWVKRQVERYEKSLTAARDERREYPTRPYHDCLAQAAKSAMGFTADERDFVLQGAYYSEYIDSAVATIGEVYRTHSPEAAPVGVDPDSVCIVVSYLRPRGGGIFREIQELVELWADKKVTVIVSRVPDAPPTEAVEILEAIGDVRVILANDGSNQAMASLHAAFRDAAPAKAYFFLHHFDTFGATLIQRGPCTNIVSFSFDHGYVNGVSNPNVDIIIAKRPIDYHMLREVFGDRVRYIPTANKPALTSGRTYTPFSGHSQVVTASGAARFYKLGGPGEDSYIGTVVRLLEATGGRHFHIGPVPASARASIKKRLAKAGLDEDRFVFLGWVDSVAEAMLDNDVDVFLEPFPTVSYKLTLDLYSAGIPVMSRTGLGRMGTVDFTYPGSLTWSTGAELSETLRTIDADVLRKHSELSLEYFDQHHNYERVHEALRDERQLDEPDRVDTLDARLHDVYDFAGLFPTVKPVALTPAYQLPSAAPATAPQSRPAPKRSRAKVDAKIRRIESSASYRIGRLVTGDVFRRHKPALNRRAELARLEGSAALGVGLWLTAPVRGVVRAVRKHP
jgi:glycosyltransferase involved in cell wall biosynthesis